MHVAQFVQRYPPALGGAEAYTARLCEYLAPRGDRVTVWTTTAVELAEFWRSGPPSGGCQPPEFRQKTRRADTPRSGGDTIRRYPPLHFPGRRYVLKAASLVPIRPWQCLTLPCNPVCPAMWRDAGRYAGPLDAVHATAFPYAFPILCGLRLARRRGVPFFLTPFLHLGDLRTRKQYTSAPLRWLLKQANRVFVQTQLEHDTVTALGVQPGRVVLQGLGVDPAECTGGDRDAARRAWGVSPGEVVIGHLANNSAEKGTNDLLAAASRAWAVGHRFRVVLAGPEMPNFRAFWERYAPPSFSGKGVGGLGSSPPNPTPGPSPTGRGEEDTRRLGGSLALPKNAVIRLGVLTDAQKRDFFAGIDVFALPSRSDSFGLVLLEAWANGKPNLVYQAGGPGELVRSDRDGLHARCGDVADLAVQLGRLVSDAGLRRRLGDTGQSRIAGEFGWADKLEMVREAMRGVTTPQSAVPATGTPPPMPGRSPVSSGCR